MKWLASVASIVVTDRDPPERLAEQFLNWGAGLIFIAFLWAGVGHWFSFDSYFATRGSVELLLVAGLGVLTAGLALRTQLLWQTEGSWSPLVVACSVATVISGVWFVIRFLPGFLAGVEAIFGDSMDWILEHPLKG